MDWIRLLVEYGDWLAAGILIASAIGIFQICRKGRFFLPRNFAGWASVIVLVAICLPAQDWLVRMGTKNAALKRTYQYSGKHAPDVAFKAVDDGSEHHLSDYAGKVVVLNVWATWCPGCVAEMPDLDRLQRAYPDKNVVVVTLSDEDVEQIRRFKGLKAMELVKGNIGPQETTEYIAPDSARPVTYLIDESGVLRHTLVGPHSYEFYKSSVDSLIASHAAKS